MFNFSNLNNLLRRFAEENLAGYAHCAAKDNDIVYEDYHGYADIKSKKPITCDTHLFVHAAAYGAF
jgi:hypothetical protein